MANPSAPLTSRKVDNDYSLAALLEEVMDNFLLENINDHLPAQVVSFDQLTNRVEVQPLIKMVTTDGRQINRATISSIPVFSLGSSKIAIKFNLQSGDLGWIKASDADISLFLQNYTNSSPNTFRKHSFSDAIFYPDYMRGFSFSENMVISTPDGSVKIGFNDTSIDITAPTVNINATNTNLGTGGNPIARQGDPVIDGSGSPIGTIGITGSTNTST